MILIKKFLVMFVLAIALISTALAGGDGDGGEDVEVNGVYVLADLEDQLPECILNNDLWVNGYTFATEYSEPGISPFRKELLGFYHYLAGIHYPFADELMKVLFQVKVCVTDVQIRNTNRSTVITSPGNRRNFGARDGNEILIQRQEWIAKPDPHQRMLSVVHEILHSFRSEGASWAFEKNKQFLKEITAMYASQKIVTPSEFTRLMLDNAIVLPNYRSPVRGTGQNYDRLSYVARDIRLVRFLVEEAGVNVNGLDVNGRNILWLPEVYRSSELAEFLQIPNINPNLRDPNSRLNILMALIQASEERPAIYPLTRDKEYRCELPAISSLIQSELNIGLEEKFPTPYFRLYGFKRRGSSAEDVMLTPKEYVQVKIEGLRNKIEECSDTRKCRPRLPGDKDNYKKALGCMIQIHTAM